MNLKPNEQVVKVGKGNLYNEEKTPIKVILTNQKRLYLQNSGIHDEELENFKEITYFNRNFFNKDGVHFITNEKEVKITIKKRNNWEKYFSSLY